jgi:hypothetical protein
MSDASEEFLRAFCSFLKVAPGVTDAELQLENMGYLKRDVRRLMSPSGGHGEATESVLITQDVWRAVPVVDLEKLTPDQLKEYRSRVDTVIGGFRNFSLTEPSSVRINFPPKPPRREDKT